MIVRDLGLMEYTEAWQLQKELAIAVADGEPDTLLFVEHPHILTLGAAFHEENLLHALEHYRVRGIDIQRTDRGGDVTYHGPNQLVIYPIFNLRRHGQDLHKWIRGLEETILQTCAAFDLEGRRFPPHTGVWILEEKVAAIGIKVKRWVSMHGIALNCDNDLGVFDTFVPCGIRGYGVTSLSKAASRIITTEDAKPIVADAFESLFSQGGSR